MRNGAPRESQALRSGPYSFSSRRRSRSKFTGSPPNGEKAGTRNCEGSRPISRAIKDGYDRSVAKIAPLMNPWVILSPNATNRCFAIAVHFLWCQWLWLSLTSAYADGARDFLTRRAA